MGKIKKGSKLWLQLSTWDEPVVCIMQRRGSILGDTGFWVQFEGSEYDSFIFLAEISILSVMKENEKPVKVRRVGNVYEFKKRCSNKKRLK